MIISVIGAGALGKSYGGLLALSHHEVHYLVRSEYEAIQKKGFFSLEFKNTNETLKIKQPRLYTKASELPPSDVVIIALKTTENKHIESLLSSCLKKDTIVLIIQNGIGNEEWISQFTGDSPVICGVASMGAFRVAPAQVEIPITGELRLAPYKKENLPLCEKIQALFKECPVSFPIIINESYKELRWHKLLWNVPFSSLSIIYSQDTATLASTQPYASIVRNFMGEVVDIAKSEGVIISPDTITKMLAFTASVKDYYPSMFRDFTQGKSIEKEYIIDNVLKIAQKNGIKTPVLSLIENHLTQKMKD